LPYAITKKIKHILRMNIFDKNKIVINSPEVHFGIKRSHAEVGTKIYLFLAKNHLERFILNTK
jgi:hypothetical protein